MNKMILILISSIIYIPLSFSKQPQSEEAMMLPKKMNSVGTVPASKTNNKIDEQISKKFKNLFDQIDMPELKNIVNQVSQKYRSQLSKPSDKNTFLKALQNAQEEIVNKYLEKHTL